MATEIKGGIKFSMKDLKEKLKISISKLAKEKDSISSPSECMTVFIFTSRRPI